MNVGFNPVVSFKSDTNLIAAKVNSAQSPQTIAVPDSFIKAQEVNSPHSWETEQDRQKRLEKEQESLIKITNALEEGKSLDGILRGTGWEKKYDKSSDSVHVKIPNSYDGAEFTIKSDGTVIKTSGWSNPVVEMEANQEMADYVKAVKNGKVDEYFANLDRLKAEKSNDNYEAPDKAKIDLFNQRLNDRQWKKEYLPESDIVYVKHKKIQDEVEYIIEKDGTVKETGLRIKPSVIMEANSQMAETFGKIKHKQSPETDKPHKSLWFKSKEGVSKIWKFFSVAGTMTVAATKGLVQGAVVGVGVLASAILLKGGISLIKGTKSFGEIAKHPFATAGKSGKLLAIAAGGAVLAGHLIKGKLTANQNSAVIEHKMDVEHVND